MAVVTYLNCKNINFMLRLWSSIELGWSVIIENWSLYHVILKTDSDNHNNQS